MSTKTLLTSRFRYKASVDGELLEALAFRVDEKNSDRFEAALRVLNHANMVDRIFAANLQQQRHGYKISWANEAPALTDLAVAIKETDEWYLAYVSKLTAEELEEAVDFAFTDGSRGRMSREEMLAHVVTHSGYHRGEAGRLLPEIENTAMRDVFAGYLHRVEPERRR